LRTDRPLPPVYMDLDDVEHKVFLREMSQPPKWASKPLMYLQWPALMLGERRAIQLTRKTFVCSDADVRYLRRTLGLSNVSLIPNSIDIPAPQPTSGEPALLFLGAYGYKPNVVAATELIREIWPFVRSACPAARLIIAGASPERIPCFAEHHEGVEYAGFVEDLDQIYRRARAVCCPIRSGGGTRIKIIEAAAYGKAIVSTPLGAEGLDFTDGSEIMLRDDPGAFAAACIELLRNDRLCERIGAAARARATARYDRQSVIRLVQGEIFGSSAEETQTGREARSDNTEKPNAANV
jgi:glycosyltransferase involved in cell wall biosynthesis